MRKVMSKKVVAAAKLPKRRSCKCPLPSRLPEGPMVEAGGAAGLVSTSVPQSRRHRVRAVSVLCLGEKFVQVTIHNSGNVVPLKCGGKSSLFLLGSSMLISE